MNYDLMISGYTPKNELLKEIKYAREASKDAIYVCDPVLGDDG